MLSRKFGLITDHIQSVEMVTVNAQFTALITNLGNWPTPASDAANIAWVRVANAVLRQKLPPPADRQGEMGSKKYLPASDVHHGAVTSDIPSRFRFRPAGKKNRRQ
jgi:hypothetical protein